LDPTAGDVEHLNFSYYHEISHHLIRNDNILYGFLNDLAGRNEDFDALVERFANIGAAEFLIPLDEIYHFLSVNGFSIKLLPELDLQYPASKLAIAIQMAQCSSHRCFVVVCKYGPFLKKDSEQEGLISKQSKSKSRLYIQYSSSSPSQDKYSIAKNTLVPDNHILNSVFQKQGYLKGMDDIPFKSGTKWKVDCEALFYKGKVYGVFNISQPAIPFTLQPSLF
jgi:Zn-dependent peptidase ImmA (M78 family)